ncbi:MAG TPA: DUF2752 domain-containing protein [Sedimentisphaerales bacterium]|nr:DUF2752 domain-containing protein [Sedimentisphaerales bacterium]
MAANQQSDTQKSARGGRVGPRGRLIAGAVFAVAAAIFVVVNWGERTGRIRWEHLFNPCGFKQRTRLPCAACGMTRAVRQFAVGRIGDALYSQPAGGVLCLAVSAAALYSLVVAVTGSDWGVLPRVRRWRWPYILLTVVIVIASAWAVTLVRALSKLH